MISISYSCFTLYCCTTQCSCRVWENISTVNIGERGRRGSMKMLVLPSIQYLARSLRGNHGKATEMELNSNLSLSMLLRAEDDYSFRNWFKLNLNLWYQRFKMVTFGALRKISINIQNANFYTIMVIEITIFNKEPVVICIHLIGDDLDIYENIVSMKLVVRTTVEEIGEGIIKKVWCPFPHLWFLVWISFVLRYINHCRLFNAQFILIHINSSISNNSV